MNEQLDRRIWPISLSRCAYDDDFETILNTFQARLPLQNPPNLAEMKEYLYKGSVGCIGILAEWLYYSLAFALEENEGVLNRAILENFQLSRKTLDKVLSQIISGNNNVNEITANSLDGFDPFDDNPKRDKTQSQTSEEGKEAPQSKADKPKNKPGIPNPQRYEVGNQER